ncbi:MULTISPECIES: hypothetical protein [unclassified Micromonospora]|uniref:hypothetical protein n=1 Tax=Verrucosispora sp. WMMC514 TaxID=3015156 RepID=UPI0022B60B45|nr:MULTISPECIES: hypothetical protein [unclassified Micromonospora]MCZ7418697.1 hypothetical protein [Verrucosispora sp. WMMA2121]WBB92399.1 hypothetical protein O7597_05160 [Verrucosispora sp. WMMC514]
MPANTTAATRGQRPQVTAPKSPIDQNSSVLVALLSGEKYTIIAINDWKPNDITTPVNTSRSGASPARVQDARNNQRGGRHRSDKGSRETAYTAAASPPETVTATAPTEAPRRHPAFTVRESVAHQHLEGNPDSAEPAPTQAASSTPGVRICQSIWYRVTSSAEIVPPVTPAHR